VAASVRFGVIGCGAIATAVHLRVLRNMPNVRVAALADPAPEARARAGRVMPGAVALASAEDLLARTDLDAVLVAAPSGVHAPLALAALASGRHLYLEKPIATTVADGCRVAAAARDSGRVTAIGFNWRFQPLIARARELVRADMIGKVRVVYTAFSEPSALPAWKTQRRDGGGVLLDLGSHHFDLIRWILGTEIEHVDATVHSEVTEQDSAFVRLGLADGGAVASCFFSFRASRTDTLELIGDRGSLRVDRYARTLTVRGVRARTTTAATLAWRARATIRPQTEPSWSNLLRAFVRAIGGGDVELPTVEDGLKSLKIVAAAEHASGLD
jgi:myo-inositol 2-dehydrogenase / D-chiro-inositol 1-dehydrogenase